MAAAAAVLPPRAAAVAMKTPVVTAMSGAQTTINNQLYASTATARMMTMETNATAAAEALRQHLGGGGQLGSGGGSLARARGWRRRQRSGGVGSGSAAVGFTKARRAMMISQPRLAWQRWYWGPCSYQRDLRNDKKYQFLRKNQTSQTIRKTSLLRIVCVVRKVYATNSPQNSVAGTQIFALRSP
jgi:hypothetical protein